MTVQLYVVQYVVNKLWKGYQAKFGGNVSNLCRWFSYMESMPLVHKCVQQMAAIIKKKGSSHDSSAQLKDRQQKKREVEGGFNIDLPNAEMDKVVTRFPPEPSGYLHIGHAKAALLNYYFARKYNGRMLMRFDDTNPAKEKAEYEQGIIEDLNRLEIKYSGKITYTSDYFDYIEECCEKLIKERKAYVDDTPVEQFRMEKMEGIDSKNREQSTERNLELWEEMKKGTTKGRECAVRAKIDMQHENKVSLLFSAALGREQEYRSSTNLRNSVSDSSRSCHVQMQDRGSSTYWHQVQCVPDV